ncbi:MAG TPA: hypothetical protein VMX33_13225 [bacterium]|nr:hypothetical protein [bacterium]
MAVIPSPEIDETQDIPTQVFERFLSEMESAGASSEIIVRLRKTLLVDQVYTEIALKAAILGEEALL